MQIATSTAVAPPPSRSTTLLKPATNIITPPLRLSMVAAHFKCLPTLNRKLSICYASSSSSSMATEASAKFPQVSARDTRVLQFVKYHGFGNDFILVDNRSSSEPKVTPEEAVKLCDRNFWVGADGIIFVMPGVDGTDYTMRIFNSDGSEPEMCCNGVRCFAKFIAELENLHGRHSFTVHTGAGLIVPEILEDGKVRVDMGKRKPILGAADVPTKLPATKGEAVVKAELDVDGTIWNVTCVSMGNPHCITFGAKGSQMK